MRRTRDSSATVRLGISPSAIAATALLYLVAIVFAVLAPGAGSWGLGLMLLIIAATYAVVFAGSLRSGIVVHERSWTLRGIVTERTIPSSSVKGLTFGMGCYVVTRYAMELPTTLVQLYDPFKTRQSYIMERLVEASGIPLQIIDRTHGLERVRRECDAMLPASAEQVAEARAALNLSFVRYQWWQWVIVLAPMLAWGVTLMGAE
jgi:hypothetical protein